MKRPNITPGPWKATNSNQTEIYARHKHAPTEFVTPVASACFNGERRSKNLPHHLVLSEAQANARAIAALPELLAALESALNTLEDCEPSTAREVKAALIKAGYTFD